MSDLTFVFFRFPEIWKFFGKYFTAHRRLQEERIIISLLRMENKCLESKIDGSDSQIKYLNLKVQCLERENNEVKKHLANTVREKKVLREKLEQREDHDVRSSGLTVHPDLSARKVGETYLYQRNRRGGIAKLNQ